MITIWIELNWQKINIYGKQNPNKSNRIKANLCTNRSWLSVTNVVSICPGNDVSLENDSGIINCAIIQSKFCSSALNMTVVH